MSANWPRVKLGEVLRQVERTKSVDPAGSYRLLGVRLDGQGPFLRETVTGTETAAKSLNEVKAGDFIYSRLFAWRGAFGVIADELDSCYVSSEFPLFRPTERAITQFLFLWFRLNTTLADVEALCSGSTPLTRNRLKEERFLALEIPLPPPDEQRRIVARVDTIADRIAAARREQQAVTGEVNRLLAAKFRNLTQDAPRKPMAEVAPLVRRRVEIDIEGSYPELGIRSFGNGTFHKPPLSGGDVGTKKLFRIHPGDLVFSNVFAWEGAIAVAQPEDDGRFGSHRFITCVPNPKLATSPFLWFYFQTAEGAAQIQDASPGGAGRNRTLGIEALARIPVPVLSVEKQREFDALQAKADALKALQAASAAELDALLPAVLAKAFAGEL